MLDDGFWHTSEEEGDVNKKTRGFNRVAVIVESVGIGLFYIGILAFFLYPGVKAASNAA